MKIEDAMLKLPTLKHVGLALVGFVFLAATLTKAQAQTVTLTATNGQPSSYNCNTNQIITVNSFITTIYNGDFGGSATIAFHSGRKMKIYAYEYGLNFIQNQDTVGYTPLVAFASGGAVFTGVTNILVNSPGFSDVIALTFTVTTPTVQSSIPANAVVIPSDATGPVQIVLESSSDLINWTSSLPGTYGNTYSNRFFRVRAIAQ